MIAIGNKRIQNKADISFYTTKENAININKDNINILLKNYEKEILHTLLVSGNSKENSLKWYRLKSKVFNCIYDMSKEENVNFTAKLVELEYQYRNKMLKEEQFISPAGKDLWELLNAENSLVLDCLFIELKARLNQNLNLVSEGIKLEDIISEHSDFEYTPSYAADATLVAVLLFAKEHKKSVYIDYIENFDIKHLYQYFDGVEIFGNIYETKSLPEQFLRVLKKQELAINKLEPFTKDLIFEKTHAENIYSDCYQLKNNIIAVKRHETKLIKGNDVKEFVL